MNGLPAELKALVSDIAPIAESSFTYFELSPRFDFSLNVISQNSFIAPHTHEQNVYNLVLNGAVVFTIGNDRRRYQKGDWIFLTRGALHSVETTDQAVLLEIWQKD